ncbi:hypothetical protein Hanom_Chr11g01028651 [Helianthus anomalus]
MKTITLRTQLYTPTHFNLITKTPPRFNLSNTPMMFDSQKVKPTPKTIKFDPVNKLFEDKETTPLLFGDKETNPFGVSKKVENLIGSEENSSRCLIVGAVTLGVVMLVMGSDDHQKALAFGPEGPLMEDFWDNMRRYGLYALTVSSGVLYAVFQPLYELLKNPISAILVLTILGGGFYIVSQVVSAMVGITDFSYELNY